MTPVDNNPQASAISPLTAGASYVRRARLADVDHILEIVDIYVATHVLLPRTRDEVVEAIGDWWVASLNDEVVGCATLRDFGDGIGELRSLGVTPEAHGIGLGEALVHAIVRDARKHDIARLFAVTRNPGYFARHGFTELPMGDVPDILHADRVPWPARAGVGHAMELDL
jgi:N-acetylglutamate synthase-like GNAT family acetyltransferase